MPMKTPPHPGRFVLEECLEPLGLSITEAASGLGVTRQTLSRLINGQTGISATMAVRLSKAFGGSPESWMQQQMLYDLAEVQSSLQSMEVKRFRTKTVSTGQSTLS